MPRLGRQMAMYRFRGEGDVHFLGLMC